MSNAAQRRVDKRSMERLQTLRERAGLTAAEVARITRLPPRTVSLIEEERFAELPRGIYARSSLRAYARAIGVAPDMLVDDLRPRLPEAPLDLLAVAKQPTPRAPAIPTRYLLAAAIDAVVLASIGLVIVAVCSSVVGVPLVEFVRAEPMSVTILVAVPTTLYFWLLGGSGLRTLGPRLLKLELLPPPTGSLSLQDWWQRGIEYAAREFAWTVKRRV